MPCVKAVVAPWGVAQEPDHRHQPAVERDVVGNAVVCNYWVSEVHY